VFLCVRMNLRALDTAEDVSDETGSGREVSNGEFCGDVG
jgi:hypothetical protein